MSQEPNLELSLAPADIWVIKKTLSSSDLKKKGPLVLPTADFERMIPDMDPAYVMNMELGYEVKVHIIEEGHEAADHTLTLIKSKGIYKLRGGWSELAQAKGYKKNDEIGLMWDKSSKRFLLHKF